MTTVLCRYLETKVEPHYGTEYHVDRVSSDNIEQWKKAGTHPDLRLPEPNPLISSLPQLGQQTKMRQPELFLFLDRIRMRAWYMSDAR